MKFTSALVAFLTMVVLAANIDSVASAVINPNIITQDKDFGIAISPPYVEFDLIPGTVTSETIRVRNTGKTETDLRIGVSPFNIVDEEYNADETSTPRTEITRWTRIALDTGCEAYKVDGDGTLYVHMRVQEECFVTFSTDTPSNAPYGSQHMNVFFQEHKEGESDGLSLIRSISSNVYGTNTTGGDTEPCGKMIKQNLPFWIFNGALETKATVENCGVLDFHTTMKMEVKSVFGKVVYDNSANSVDNILMAETTRVIKDSWQEPSIGLYTVTQTVSMLGETYEKSGMVFIIPLWLILIVLLCIVVIVLSIVYDRHKKKSGSKKRR